jgi:predicted nucleic acid-binding protein
MSEFFDSSWLIATLIADEPHHNMCREKLDTAITAGAAQAAQHSLAEVFHTITGRKGVPPEQASQLLKHNFADLEWVGLDEDDYWHCVETAHKWGVRGGAIFDLLLLHCADRHEAAHIYTLNKRHFLSFAPHLRTRIQGPDE